MEQQIRGRPCECDDERPMLTQKRLNSLSFPTLQTLTGTLILANVERFAETNGTVSRLKVLPDKLRQTLLKQLEAKNLMYKKDHQEDYVKYENKAYFEKVFAAFKVLVSGECRDICLDWLLISCPTPDKKNCAAMALEVLASEAPELQSLEFANQFDEVYGKIREFTFGLRVFSEKFAEHLLLDLGTLTRLRLGQIILKPEDLELIGLCLTKLVALKCFLSSTQTNELKVAVSKMMDNLTNLKHFDFDWDVPSFRNELSESLTTYCVKRFPQLLTVGYNGTVRLAEGQKQINISRNSELSELTVFTHEDEILQKRDCLWLPKITKLNMIQIGTYYLGRKAECEPEPDDRFLNFSHLRELSFVLFGLAIEEKRRFFQQYGRNLTTLTMRSQDDLIGSLIGVPKSVPQLSELRSLCPNLQELCIFNSIGVADLPPTFSGGQEPFMFLTTLHLKFGIPYSPSSILLAAPNLQKVIFEEVWIERDVEEIQHLADLVRTKQICMQLTCVEVLSNDFTGRDVSKAWIAWCEFIKNLCAYSPKFKQVTFRRRYKSLRDPMNLASKDCCLEKCINILDSFLFNKH